MLVTVCAIYILALIGAAACLDGLARSICVFILAIFAIIAMGIWTSM